MQTDLQLADVVFKTRYWKRYRQFIDPGRNWELPNHVRSALKEQRLDATLLPIEFEKTVQRVIKIIRSRNAKKAAQTRRRNRERKRQLTLPL
jgi:hypothetical protein